MVAAHAVLVDRNHRLLRAAMPCHWNSGRVVIEAVVGWDEIRAFLRLPMLGFHPSLRANVKLKRAVAKGYITSAANQPARFRKSSEPSDLLLLGGSRYIYLR